MHIRRSKSRDRTAVIKLARRFSSDIGLHNLPLLADHIGTDRVIVACNDSDKPLGFVYAYIKGKGYSPYSPGRDHLYVAALCVDENNRKKGIASALMGEVVKSNSHKKICGQVLCSNAAARKLYTKNGFNELYVVFSKEAFKEVEKDEPKKKVASAKPFEITSMAGGIKCPYCDKEGFDKQEFDEHLKYCQDYIKIKDTPLARPLMHKGVHEAAFVDIKCPFCGEEGFDKKGLKAHLSRGQCDEYEKVSELPPSMFSSVEGTDDIGKFYIVTKPSPDSTLVDIMFETDIKGLQNQYLGGLQSGEIEGIFTDKYVAETVAKSLLEAADPDAYDKEGSLRLRQKISELSYEDVKKPSKSEVGALIKAYALMMFSKQQNAPMVAQQRYHNNCFGLIAKMEQKYPNISFSNDSFNTHIVEKAMEYWNNRGMRGPAVDW